MSQLEKIYMEWCDEVEDSEELAIAYRMLSSKLTELLGTAKFEEIDGMIMECVCLERLNSFRGGFQQATAIWKECC